MWPLIRQLKWSPSSCIRVTSWSLGPWPGSWVIGVQPLWTASLMRCVNSSVWRNCKPHLTTPRWMGWWRSLIKLIMRMIGKLGDDKKVNWPGNLVEIVHTYNATQSTMRGYSPHYLMFGSRPRLPVNFYFPTFRSTEVSRKGASAKHVDKYVATVQEWLRATLQEAQIQSKAEAQWQKWCYDWKIGAVDLKPGNQVLVKANAFQGRRKIKDRWENKPHEVVCQIATYIPSYEVMDQHRQSCILHCNWLLLITSAAGITLCLGVFQVQAWCTSPTSSMPTPRGSDSEIIPWEGGGLMSTQHQARETSLGWINRNLWLLLWKSAGSFTEDGRRLQVMCSGHGCLQDHIHLAEG